MKRVFIVFEFTNYYQLAKKLDELEKKYKTAQVIRERRKFLSRKMECIICCIEVDEIIMRHQSRSNYNK